MVHKAWHLSLPAHPLAKNRAYHVLRQLPAAVCFGVNESLLRRRAQVEGVFTRAITGGGGAWPGFAPENTCPARSPVKLERGARMHRHRRLPARGIPVSCATRTHRFQTTPEQQRRRTSGSRDGHLRVEGLRRGRLERPQGYRVASMGVRPDQAHGIVRNVVIAVSAVIASIPPPTAAGIWGNGVQQRLVEAVVASLCQGAQNRHRTDTK